MSNDEDNLKQKNNRPKQSYEFNNYNQKNKKPNTSYDESTKQGVKMTANAAAGPLGGKAVDLASKTNLGKKGLNKADKIVKKNPIKGLNPSGRLNKLQSFRKNERTSQTGIHGSQDQTGIQEDAMSEGVAGEEISESEELSASAEVSKSVKKGLKTILPVIGISGFGFFLILICCIMAIFLVLAPIFHINDLLGTIRSNISERTEGFVEKMSNLGRCGYMSDEECENKLEEDFYSEIEEVYDDFYEEYKVRINASLLTATLTYYDFENTMSFDDTLIELDDDNNVIVTDEDNEKTSYVDFKKSKKKVKMLATKMISDAKTKILTREVTDDQGNITTEEYEVIYYELDLDKYKEYLEDEFIRDFYFDGKDDASTTLKVQRAIEDIYDRLDFYEYALGEKDSYTKVYAHCSGITVQVNGEIKTVSLEEYIAGVVAGEMGDSFDIEALKAHAIAARSYVLARTNNCTVMAGNGPSFQVYDPSKISEKTIQAAEETEGLIMTYDDEIFASQYDSFCYADSRCPDSVRNSDGTYSVTYTREPMLETHTVTLKDPEYYHWIAPGQGHAHGMSQLVAGQMAKEGSSYDEILKYFYSDGVKISNMVSSRSGLYASSTEVPVDVADIRARSEEYASMGKVVLGGKTLDLSLIYNSNDGYMGECVWYARGRMLELIYFSDMPDDQKAETFLAVSSSRGNGWQWYDGISNLEIFDKTPDYTMPHDGSFVSWHGGSDKCFWTDNNGVKHGTWCGHVAIIESVDESNNTVVYSEGWNGTGVATWNNVKFFTTTYTFEQIKNHKPTYYHGLNGYVYVMG